MTQTNQQEIADKLGLSRATVSRCFTNHPGINPETRARVFELASKLGYNHMVMRGGKAGAKRSRLTFGVLVCTSEEEYHRLDYESPGRLLIKGISEYCQLSGVGMSVHFIDPAVQTVEDEAYAELFNTAGRHWSGLLLLYPFPSRVVVELALKYPCVSLVEQADARNLDCVDVNHYQGVGMVIDRLHGLGHRRVGFYSKAYAVEAGWALRRFGAYMERMTQIGLRMRSGDMINTHPSRMVGLEESFDLAAQRVREGVTAFVCAADHQAYDLIRALLKRGLRVPEDVSVTGFDGIHVPAGMPRLSTVCIPYRNIGYVASNRLSDLLGKRYGPAQHILLDGQMREGETVCAPKK
ncbi:LacI family DNA-binding transcriptional regulator [Ruficoccus amylovorans]|uniref:LacI family DNA-binding transcriptional regulator n=1 Tax=Ruficoccus amylovorans TaxID=1804625 RepID=A0A842H9Z8_9BACT|nr:LacI family DNA-binding transcriptional regulator [Ruficoccus amylovorans]MBC2592928.1 LacI family DNA-binding transcriptional regulator [Ruficoccus amylovorans]